MADCRAGAPVALRGPVTIGLQSDCTDVRRALALLVTACRSWQLDEASVNRIEQVVAEILNNVVEHAFGWAAHGDITVTGICDDTRVRICVTDNGQPMPDNRLPDGEAVDLAVPLKDLPEGGFGWYLIREQVETLEYSREDGQNLLRVRIAVEPCQRKSRKPEPDNAA